MTNDNGQPMVIDNKFDNADGKPDGWGSKIGQGGKTQQQDYDDINKQNGAQGQGLQLNSAVCKCSATAEPEGVFVPQSDATHGRVPLIDPATPGALPGLLPGPGTSPVPVINPFPRPFAFP